MGKVYLFILFALANIATFAQNCAVTQPNAIVCSSTVAENFNSGAGGFSSPTFTLTSGSWQRTIPGNGATGSTVITSSAYFKTNTMVNAVQAGFLATAGDKITITSVTLDILDANNGDAVVASCTQTVNITNGTQTVCIGVVSPNIVTGMMFKYRFTLNTTNGNGSGVRLITFDNFSYGGNSNAALPVKLDNFDAATAGNGIKLTWIASDEMNLSKFEIERSSNGTNFSLIGSVPAEKKKNYSYTDAAPNSTNNYYRLKMIDLDGRTRTSYIVSVKAKTTVAIETYPNPVRDNVLVQHPKAKASTFIQIVNLQGQIVKTVDVPVNAVATQVEMTTLKNGAYYLIFRSATETFSQRIVKQ